MQDIKTITALYRSVTGYVPHLPDELLLSYVESRVTPREQSRIEAHLEACLQCREDFQALRHFVQGQPAPPTPKLVMTVVEESPASSEEPDLELSTRMPEAPPVGLVITDPLEPLPAPSSLPKRRRPLPLLVPGLFLALNALGLGAIYGGISRNRGMAPPSKPTVAPASPTPTSNLPQIQSAYERRLAQERGKIARLEKLLEKLKSASPSKPTTKTLSPPKGQRLLPPGGLSLTQSQTSLSIHPTLSWEVVPRANRYAAEINDTRGKLIVKTQLGNTEWHVAAALQRGKVYQWKVTPFGPEGKALKPVQTGKLTIAKDDDASQVSEQLKTLATELGRLGYTEDAQALTASAELLLRK